MTVLLSVLGVIVVLVVTMTLLRLQRVDRTPLEVADILERFVAGTGSDSEWDDFISVRIRKPDLEAISRRCGRLPDEFPPDDPGSYTNPHGIAVIQGFIAELRRRMPDADVSETTKELS